MWWCSWCPADIIMFIPAPPPLCSPPCQMSAMYDSTSLLGPMYIIISFLNTFSTELKWSCRYACPVFVLDWHCLCHGVGYCPIRRILWGQQQQPELISLCWRRAENKEPELAMRQMHNESFPNGWTILFYFPCVKPEPVTHSEQH